MAAKLKPESARDVDSLRKVLTFIGEKKLRELYLYAVDKKNKLSESAGSLGKRISESANNDKLHAQAFGLAVRMGRMEEGKRAIFLASFDHYREKLNLDKIKQGSLDFSDEEEGATDKPKAAGKTPEPTHDAPSTAPQ